MHSYWAGLVKEGLARTSRRHMLRPAGLDNWVLERPLIGVITVTGDNTPCSKPSCPFDLRLSPTIAASDEVSISCSTISAADGTSTNEIGSRIPRASRELIADCVELVIRRLKFEAVVAIAGGDKTIPGVMMAMARLNLPSVFVYGGGSVSDAHPTPEYACAPTVGVCQRQFAADSMAMVAQTLGLSPLSSVATPAAFSERAGQARQAGEIALRILDEGSPLPRDLITRKSLDNACAAVAATGSSTNATLQLPAIAHEAGVSFTVHDLAPVFKRTLIMAEGQPGGRDLAGTLYRSAGVPAVLRSLLAGGALHGEALTIDAVQLQAALSSAAPVDQDSLEKLTS